MDVDYAMELWGLDPIHPTENGYSALAAALTSFCQDTIAQAQAAAEAKSAAVRPHSGPNQSGERPGLTVPRRLPRDSKQIISYAASGRTPAIPAAAQPTRAAEAAGAGPRATPSSGSAASGAAAGGGGRGGTKPSPLRR